MKLLKSQTWNNMSRQSNTKVWPLCNPAYVKATKRSDSTASSVADEMQMTHTDFGSQIVESQLEHWCTLMKKGIHYWEAYVPLASWNLIQLVLPTYYIDDRRAQMTYKTVWLPASFCTSTHQKRNLHDNSKRFWHRPRKCQCIQPATTQQCIWPKTVRPRSGEPIFGQKN